MSSSHLLDTCSHEHRFPIPKTYKFLQILGEGSYGTVIKCVNQKTGEILAVKINKKNDHSLHWEAFVMKTLMVQNMDNYNIIRYEGEIFANRKMSITYEMLDVSLQDYLTDLRKPMQLKNIRTVIQQMAVALNALATMSVIHTDVKIDNIMLVDHVRQPFKVKLIDFGLATFKWQARLRTVCQAPSIAAPEVMLGLPVSEAIDIWSLGCAMAIMIFREKLFPGNVYQEVLPHMTDLLGTPPAHLLNAGVNSRRFFKKTVSNSWQLKEPDMDGSDHFKTKKRYKFPFLDEMKMMDNSAEVDERRECIHLLKEMLQWDPKERITPSGILNHPFITKTYLNSSSQHRNCNEPEPSTSQTPLEEKSERLSRRVIEVQPVNQNSSDRNSDTPSNHAASPGSFSDPTNAPMENKPSCFSKSEDCFPKESKDEKKKNCFQRFFSWMKRKLGSS